MQELDRGTRVARKPHQCFDCYSTIPKGARYAYFTGVMDGSAYTLCSHDDCEAARLDYISEMDPLDFTDGVPPLHDMLGDSGEFEAECDRMRGCYPHVVCRMEYIEQMADAMLEARRSDHETD